MHPANGDQATNQRTATITRAWRLMLVLAVAALFAPLATHVFAQGGTQPAPSAFPPAPATRTDNVVDDYFGTKITDPYRWLEDQNSPETRAWINSQNSYTASVLGKLPDQEALHKQLSALYQVNETGLPAERGGRLFFMKRLATEDQAKLYMRQGAEGKDALLVDPLPMSADHSVTIALQNVSSDGRMLVYGVRHGGADEVVPHLFDVDAHKNLPDEFPSGRYSGIAITADRAALYYTLQTSEGPRIFWHKIGTAQSADRKLFGDGYGPEISIGSSLSEDGNYLLIHVSHGSAADRTEVYIQKTSANQPFVPVVNDVSARFRAEIAGDKIYIHTNWNAPKGQILVTDISQPSKDHWTTVVPESDVAIVSMALRGGKIAVLYTRDASSQLKIFGADGKPVRDVNLPTIGTASGLAGEWDSNVAFYSFSSFFVPDTIYRYDLATGAQAVWARTNIAVNPARFTIQQVWYNSKDGTRIPMFVAHLKTLKMDGSNPALMTAYGGFNLNVQPSFANFPVSPMVLAWIENGGVFALPVLRGGGEFGEEWHRAAMFEKKQNVFDDFYAGAEYLIAQHYTGSSKLAAMGMSNGGLLMGAAMTQRPDLFAAIICEYPLLDMLRYEKFLVARYWVPEYGSAENPQQFQYLYKYSPYQHVTKGQKYPGVLFITGDADTRVAPLHARKMTALMQADVAPGRPILLFYDTHGGHSGGTPASKQADDAVRMMTFLYWQLGVNGH
ncbi:MAG TPA: prolyl oligopeptidase family serine peptidase [Candidatus Acidoferrales bacterium]|nr:prolyl oligopeptidase family serine peptidase [Candidatus Acidoferrales bacterium]